MGLVDYSDSESDSEVVQPKAAAAPKKTFQKLLDRSSGSGKIVVSLPTVSTAVESGVDDAEQPPAKRAKTAGASRFSGLGSFLPPPKKTGASAPAPSANKQGTAPTPGFRLRTAAEPAFVRHKGGSTAAETAGGDTTSESIAPSRGPAGPSIPEGQKPEEEVKLVGKPLMFKPLSVARMKQPAKPKKKEPAPVAAGTAPTRDGHPPASSAITAPTAQPTKTAKVSLFSIGDDQPSATLPTAATGTYESLFTPTGADPYVQEDHDADEAESAVTSAYPIYHPDPSTHQHNNNNNTPNLSDLASTLSPAARRELFGRAGPPSTSSTTPSSTSSSQQFIPPNAKVISFDMEREYAHNEALRSAAAGEQLAYNPVRAIAPGKHSLRQVVNMAQSNQGALEESFARAKNSQRDAAGRYGWK